MPVAITFAKPVVGKVLISYHVLCRERLQPSCLRKLRLRPVNSGVRPQRHAQKNNSRSIQTRVTLISLHSTFLRERTRNQTLSPNTRLQTLAKTFWSNRMVLPACSSADMQRSWIQDRIRKFISPVTITFHEVKQNKTVCSLVSREGFG